MRIQQIKTPTNWLAKSDDPGRSLHAWICGAWDVHQYSWYLIDDQRLGAIGTQIEPISVTTLDADTGITFVAKDKDTLKRGFAELVRKVGDHNDKYRLTADDFTGLTAFYIEWNEGSIRSKNVVTAGLSAIGHNTGEALKRFGIAIFPAKGFLKRHGVTIDHYMSVAQAVKEVSRDGKMVKRGAALYICLNSAFPVQQPKWGRVWRQIDHFINLSKLKAVLTKLSK